MGDHATSEGVTGVWLRTATTGVAHMLIWGISVVAWAGLGTALPGVVWAAGVALAGLVALGVVGWRWVRTRRLDLGSPAAGGTARGFRRSLAASWPLLAAAACLGAGMVWLATQLPIQGFDLAFFSIAAGLCVGGLCADRLDRRRGVVVVRRDARAGGRGLVVLARVSATS
jgi:hypothetical protein